MVDDASMMPVPQSDTSRPGLRVSHLRKVYPGKVQAIAEVSFDFSSGIFGLLGPNGAGKSTLLRILATLEQPDAGTVFFDNIDVLKTPTLLRRQLGYLPQSFGVYPRTSAWAMLDHIAEIKGITVPAQRKEAVNEILHRVNLYDVRYRWMDSFSGGMKQRFGLAQAIVAHPKLLIVDEPSAGLDPEERNRLHNLLAEIGENATVILATHLLEDVQNLCQEVAIFANGRILVQSSPQQLVAAYEGKVWKKSISQDEIRTIQAQNNLISCHQLEGKLTAHTLGDSPPFPGFVEKQATLEDAYFATIAEHLSPSAAISPHP